MLGAQDQMSDDLAPDAGFPAALTRLVGRQQETRRPLTATAVLRDVAERVAKR